MKMRCALLVIASLPLLLWGEVEIAYQERFDAQLAEEVSYAFFERIGLCAEGDRIEAITIEDVARVRTQHAELIAGMQSRLQNLQDTVRSSVMHRPEVKGFADYCIRTLFIAVRTLSLVPDNPVEQRSLLIAPHELVRMIERHIVLLMKELRAALTQRGIDLLAENLTGQALGLIYPLYVRLVSEAVCMAWFVHNFSPAYGEQLLAEQRSLMVRLVPVAIEFLDAVVHHAQVRRDQEQGRHGLHE